MRLNECHPEMPDGRLKREAQFHDQAFADNTRARARKFYAVAGTAVGHYHQLIDENCAGKRVLEYGCGSGSHAFALSRLGASVVGIDLSAEGIRQAVSRARDEDLLDRLSFKVMNAEALEFPDAHFDVVCGSGILHHLDLDAACRELVRVLRTGGRAVFFEPLGHNLLINLYRRLTPELRTEDEHPLVAGNLQTLVNYFHEAHIGYYTLCALAAVPFRRWPGFKVALWVLERIDRMLLRLPFVKKQAWLVVIQLDRPRK